MDNRFFVGYDSIEEFRESIYTNIQKASYQQRTDINFILEAIKRDPLVMQQLPKLFRKGELKVKWLQDESFMLKASKVSSLVLFYSGLDPSQLEKSVKYAGKVKIKVNNENYIGISNEQIIKLAQKLDSAQSYLLLKEIGKHNKYNLKNFRSLEHHQNLSQLLFGKVMMENFSYREVLLAEFGEQNQ